MVSIELSVQIEAPIERCFDLARSVAVHLSSTEQTGEEIVGGVRSGLIGPGDWVECRATHFAVRQRLTSKITEFERPVYFQDTMQKGAFRSMQHDHFFEALSADCTEMRDRFMFAAPVPVLGVVVERLFLKSYIERFLLRRNEVLKKIAESERWREFLPE